MKIQRRTGIVAFAFGAPEIIWPNQKIAQLASEKAREIGAPVFTQRDVPIKKGLIDVCFIKEDPFRPPTTLQIAKKAVEWAQKRELGQILIFAAPPHAWRCARDIREIIFRKRLPIETQISRETQKNPKGEWFTPDSLQARTRTRENWELRENLLRIAPFFIYEIVAG